MNLEVSDVNIAAVAGGFPSAQTFTEVKIAEAALAVAEGANEIDIVMNVGQFLSGEYEDICDEIAEIKHSCHGDARLKVILETGALGNYSNVKKAALLAIYSGADFYQNFYRKTESGRYSRSFLRHVYRHQRVLRENTYPHRNQGRRWNLCYNRRCKILHDCQKRIGRRMAR